MTEAAYNEKLARQRARDLVSDDIANGAIKKEDRAKYVESYTRTILRAQGRDTSHYYPNDVWS